MNEPNLYTLKLKLDRHKIHYIVMDDDVIEIKGSKNNIALYLLYVGLPIVILGAFLFANYILDLSVQYFSVVLLIYAFYNINLVRNKIKNNQGVKIIANGFIEIGDGIENVIYKKEDISEITTKVELGSKTDFLGELKIIGSDGINVLFISLISDDKLTLKDDINYIKRYIELNLS